MKDPTLVIDLETVPDPDLPREGRAGLGADARRSVPSPAGTSPRFRLRRPIRRAPA